MLSIIIPALNEEKYLPFLLEAITKQSPENYEIIVADAGSKDKTVEIAKRYGCRVVAGGLPAHGRNEGANAARGKILFFIDADNSIPDDFFKNALEEFERRRLDVGSFMLILTDNNKIISGIFSLACNFWLIIFEKIRPFGAANIIIKKQLHEKIGGFDEFIRVGEDIDYLRRAARVGRYGILRSEKIFFPMRRWQKGGYLKTTWTYIFMVFYMLFLKPPRKEVFKYPFDIYGDQNG